MFLHLVFGLVKNEIVSSVERLWYWHSEEALQFAEQFVFVDGRLLAEDGMAVSAPLSMLLCTTIFIG